MTGFDVYKEYLVNNRKKELENSVANKTYNGEKRKGWFKSYKATDLFKTYYEEAEKTDKTINNIRNYDLNSKEGIFYTEHHEAIDFLLSNGKSISTLGIENFYVDKAINEMDISSVEDHYATYEQKVLKAVDSHFKNSVIRYYKRNYNFYDYNMYGRNYPHTDKEAIKLSVNTVGDFIDEYEKVAFQYPCLVGISYCKTYFQKHFLKWIMKLKPANITTPRAKNNFEKRAKELVSKKGSFADRLANKLAETYTIFHIFELLEQNSFYSDSNPYGNDKAKDIISTAHSIATLQADILDTIPNHYPDFYPNARAMKRHFILHIGPTNSGKTYSAIKALKIANSGVYLAPLRLLAYEQFDNLNKNGIFCTLLTGEESIEIPFSNHTASTVEMLNTEKRYDVAVIDEAQMIADKFRGGAWTRAILGVCASEVHVCLAPQAERIITNLIKDCGDTYEVHMTERQTTLTYAKPLFRFPESIQDGDALIVFSRKDVHAVAAELTQLNIPCSMIYGNLPYDVRHREAEKFNKGETKVVVATDAIGMGLNMPIKRVVFLRTEKYDGEQTRPLLPEEVQQIAGRAGRYGIFDEGLYTREASTEVNVCNLYEKEVAPLKTAYLSFPESLINLNVNLSRILKKWNDIPTNNPYYKANIDREIELCEYLESYTNDKHLMYELITIPFADKDDDIRELWNKLSTDIIANRISKYKHLINPDYGKDNRRATLDTLEHDYKVCDLVYYFASKFWHDKEIVAEVMQAKARISKLTMIELDRKAIKVKKCSKCGSKLSWNHKFNLCDNCYYKSSYYRNSYWNDDFDFDNNNDYY